MATVNRYTKIKEAEYNPMSLNELMMVPQYKRQQHDNLLETGVQLDTELAKVDPLSYHSQSAIEEQNRLREQIDAQTNLLSTEGFNPGSKEAFIKLNREYQKSIAPTGTLGQINNAKKVLQANRDAHIKESIKAGNSPEQAVKKWQEFEQQYAQQFQETGKINPIGQLGAPEFVDYIESANEVFKNVGFTQEEIANGMVSNIVFDDEKGSYVLTQGGSGSRTKNNYKQLNEALEIMNRQIQDPNSKLRRSLQYNDTDPNRVLSEITSLAKSKLIDDRKTTGGSSKISSYKTAKELGLNDKGNAMYDTTEASNVIRFDNDLSSALDDIISGKQINVNSGKTDSVNSSNVASFNAFGTTSTSFSQNKATASVKNHMSGKQKEEYDKLYEGLKNDNPTLLLHDKYSPEVAEEINNYIKDSSNLLRQNFIIQDDFVKEYGTSKGAASKNRKEIDDYIKTNISDQTFGYNGQEFTYDQLPEDVRLKVRKAKYSGYLSPKNFEGLDKDSNKDLYVSPHVYELYDEDTGEIEKLYVGRKAGERNSPEFKAARNFNQVYQKSKYRPNINHNIPELKADIKYDKNKDLYILKDTRTGEITAMDEISLQNAIYDMHGVKN